MNAVRQKLDDFAPPPTPVKRWTVEEYHKLLDCGFFAENESFELIDGWIIPKCKRSPWHCAVQNHLLQRFVKELPGENYLSANCCSVTMSASEPELDLAIVRGPERYFEHHPYPEDVLIAIEVCEQNTVARDCDLKMDLYAREGISEYWIIDRVAEELRVFKDPIPVGGTAAKYKSCETYPRGKTVPLVLDGHTYMRIALDRFFQT
jgi:Uma2 family endonuclease